MKKVIIVGGGIAGLSAGIFGRLQGFDTTIYEMHSIPGGECTGWNRRGYHFDNCIHWLTGTNPKTDLYKVWETVGAFENTELYTAEYFNVDARGEKPLYFYKDLQKLQQHFIDVSPEDEEKIKGFVEDIKSAQQVEMPTKKPMALMNLLDYLDLARTYKPIMSRMKVWSGLSVAEYANQFKSPLLQQAIKSLLYEECPINNLFFMLGTYTSGNGGWPMGGSLAMGQRMAKRYESLGGKICYKMRVDEILLKDKKTVGVRLANGEIIKSDYVISAGDGMMLLKKLLRGKVRDKKLATYEENKEGYIYPITVDIGLGVKVDLSHRPHQGYYKVKPFKFRSQMIETIGIKHYCKEKGFAPEGCSSIRIQLKEQDQRYWQELKQSNPEAYKQEKETIVQNIIAGVEEVFPETKGMIEVWDICTPATYERYCDAYNGCWMAPLPKRGEKTIMHSGKLKGIKNLFVAGQWIMSIGGLPTAVVSGKWAIQMICKQEKIKFQHSF